MKGSSSQAVFQGFNKEVRFAVVMYGGVSLAIYINGVAQELLKMCRATKNDPKTLSSTEKLFRQIGVILANEKLSKKLLEKSDSAEIEKEIEKSIDDDSPTVKFVVDILTGTSAGGINAIFLAKALANNQKIDSLKKLWIKQGDIGLLINDKKSVADNDLDAPTKAKSLLNSDRMFIELVKAFEGMDAEKASEPLVEEIDLFVPTTDFKGVVVPVRLLDGIIEEKSFRQAFHFRFNKSDKEENEAGREICRNDFTKKHNSMLAFASRATSSFPFAFEPMRLESALKVIEQCFEDGLAKAKNLTADCERFFPYIVDKNGEKIEWKDRDLIDGGVLDNKPFSHAISVLSQRRADFQVERKLLYIEPSPESFSNKNRKSSGEPPDVLENAIASLSSIPGYETIREDLEKLFERNRLIERVNTIINSAEEDVFRQLANSSGDKIFVDEKEKKSGDWWAKQGLEDVAELKGRAVLSYYRLRIASLTDDITRLVTKIIGIDDSSEYFALVRDLVRTWRTSRYKDYKDENQDRKETILGYLRNYDLSYRLRRLRFVQQKLSRLYFFDNDFSDELRKRHDRLKTIRTEKERKSKEIQNAENITENPFIEGNIRIQGSVSRTLRSRLDLTDTDRERKPSEILYLVGGDSEEDDFQIQIQKSVEYFLNKLGEVYKKLQKSNRDLQNLSENDLEKEREAKVSSKKYKFFAEVKKIGKKLSEELKKEDKESESGNPDRLSLLDAIDKKAKKAGISITEHRNIWEPFKRDIDSASKRLEEYFREIFDEARITIDDLLETDFENVSDKRILEGVEPTIFNAVRGYLCHYYNNFDDYDQMSFPIFYQTQVGEAVKVDVMRISPMDAKSLIDLSDPKETRQKVAGESIFHFGAFLDGTWRWNDIMWGRLDGAERLITALMPDKQYEHLRAYFTKKMHLEILHEEICTSNTTQLQTTLAESLAKTSSGLDFREVIGKITQGYSDDVVKTKLKNILGTIFSREEVYEFVKTDYKYEEKTEPKRTLEVVSRSTRVVGDIFEGIADKHGVQGDKFRLISRAGQIFWGLVEVAAPNSFWNLLFNHWLKLLYFFEVILIIGSSVFVKEDVQQFGVITLLLTLATHISITLLQDYMSGKRFLYSLKYLGAVLMLIFVVSGAIFFFAFFYENNLWAKLVSWQAILAKLDTWQKLFPISILVILFSIFLAWRDRQKPNIRIIGAISVIFIVFVFASNYLSNWMINSEESGSIVTSFTEFESTKISFEKVLESGDKNAISGITKAINLEIFLYIPIYVGFFLFFIQLIRFIKKSWVKWMISTLAVLVIGVAVVSLAENFLRYSLLENNFLQYQQLQINGIFWLSIAKWILTSLVSLGLSFAFWRQGLWKIISVGFFILFVLSICPLFNDAFSDYFFIGQAIIFFITGLTFLIFPSKLLKTD